MHLRFVGRHFTCLFEVLLGTIELAHLWEDASHHQVRQGVLGKLGRQLFDNPRRRRQLVFCLELLGNAIAIAFAHGQFGVLGDIRVAPGEVLRQAGAQGRVMIGIGPIAQALAIGCKLGTRALACVPTADASKQVGSRLLPIAARRGEHAQVEMGTHVLRIRRQDLFTMTGRGFRLTDGRQRLGEAQARRHVVVACAIAQGDGPFQLRQGIVLPAQVQQRAAGKVGPAWIVRVEPFCFEKARQTDVRFELVCQQRTSQVRPMPWAERGLSAMSCRPALDQVRNLAVQTAQRFHHGHLWHVGVPPHSPHTARPAMSSTPAKPMNQPRYMGLFPSDYQLRSQCNTSGWHSPLSPVLGGEGPGVRGVKL